MWVWKVFGALKLFLQYAHRVAIIYILWKEFYSSKDLRNSYKKWQMVTFSVNLALQISHRCGVFLLWTFLIWTVFIKEILCDMWNMCVFTVIFTNPVFLLCFSGCYFSTEPRERSLFAKFTFRWNVSLKGKHGFEMYLRKLKQEFWSEFQQNSGRKYS